MIGLDTNILVRHLVKDDAEQCRRVKDLFNDTLRTSGPGYVSVVAIVETVWVLEASYGLQREEIAAAVDELLRMDVLEFERAQDVFEAKTLMEEDAADFADALIGLSGRSAGCAYSMTFDKRAQRLADFAPVL